MAATTTTKRGAFILFEGIDRCGKTTQSTKLFEHLQTTGTEVRKMRFPDRTTPIGKMINGYLQNTQDMDDKAIHLLFSANRWECAKTLEETLASGTSVVCDRYVYSGQAYSLAKKVGISQDWALHPDVGLPAPDVVIYLELSTDDAQKRGQFGDERYEQVEMLNNTIEAFDKLRIQDEKRGGPKWVKINANQSITDLHDQIKEVALKTLDEVQDKELQRI